MVVGRGIVLRALGGGTLSFIFYIYYFFGEMV